MWEFGFCGLWALSSRNANDRAAYFPVRRKNGRLALHYLPQRMEVEVSRHIPPLRLPPLWRGNTKGKGGTSWRCNTKWKVPKPAPSPITQIFRLRVFIWALSSINICSKIFAVIQALRLCLYLIDKLFIWLCFQQRGCSAFPMTMGVSFSVPAMFVIRTTVTCDLER